MRPLPESFERVRSALPHAGEFDVDGAAQPGVEEQVPARVVVVVVDVDLVAVPTPIAAVVEIIGGYHPVGAIVENHVARAVIDGARDEYFPDMLVVAARITAAGEDSIVIILPTAIIVAHLKLFPGDR